ncbi:hypothetical protein A8W25_12235 [Streptomyces sp. ERV7]|nr:hypothetical protein A8W25_12235 [Streptomyces sp. ERV7]
MATQRLITERQFSTPCEWCSMPRACQAMALGARAKVRATSTIWAAGTPQISAARSGGYSAALSRTSSQPVVWAPT